MPPGTILRAIVDRTRSCGPKRRGKPSLLSRDVMIHLCEIAKLHDDQSEGLTRKDMIVKVIRASGNKLNLKQATNCWDRTIHPFG